MKNVYLLIAFILLGSQVLIAQCNPEPDPMGQMECSQATLLCCGEFDGVIGTLPDFMIPTGPNPLCPGIPTVPNNMSWFSFVAGTEFMLFEVNISNCTATQQGPGGAQIGVYEGCDFGFNLYCNGEENVGLVTIPLGDLVVGEVYFMFIDGFAGSVCDYEIDLISGSNFTVEPSPVLDIFGPQEPCTGLDDDYYSADLDFGSTSVIWTVPSELTFTAGEDWILISDWGNTAGTSVTICADGVNDCDLTPDGTTQFCRTVDVGAQSMISVAGEYCSSDIGWIFPENGLLYSEGVHIAYIPNANSCPTEYELTVTVSPSENINESFFLDFGETYTVNGVTYIAPFFGQFDNGQVGSNGCPQTLTLELTSADPNPIIHVDPDSLISCNAPNILLTAEVDIDASLNYSYIWETVNGNFISTTNQIAVVNLPGVYTVTVITEGVGTNGLLQVETTASVEIFAGTGIVLDLTGTSESCVADGMASVTATGGIAPYSYTWSNGSADSVIQNLEPGTYYVTVIDQLQCQSVASITINSVIDLEVNSTTTDCDTEDGTATATVLGGATDPSFEWSDGQVGATATDLAPDYYSVTVTDQANGCQTHENVQIIEDPSCNVFISGNVVVDENLDCIRDPSSSPQQNIRVELSDGQVDFTNANGQYSFIAEPGTYEITVVNTSLNLELLCDSTVTLDAPILGESYEDNDFYFEYLPDVDLKLKVVKFRARPGFEQQVRICLMNVGGVSASGTLDMIHPSMIDYLSSSPNIMSYDTLANLLQWDFVNIPPNTTWIYTPKFSVPADLPIGTILEYEFEATINNGVEINLEDNYIFCPFTVTGAYDPNDKSATPAGEGPLGLISAEDTAMSYTIRFQNTGNDTAFTVLLRDTLSAAFDLRTLRPGPASHEYDARIVEGNILEVLFENILLPDSFVNEPASNGFFIFDIELKSDLASGTEINNTAGIYFDFNAPIVTNTTVNTIRQPVGVTSIIEPLNFSLRPNPTADITYLAINLESEERLTVSLFNLVGEKLKVIKQGENYLPGVHLISANLSEYSNGIYFLQIESQTGKLGSQKIIKLE